MNKEIFAVLGGDERYRLLAGLLAERSYTVYASGFELSEDKADGVIMAGAAEAAAAADYVVLPLPPSRDGVSLNAPFSTQPIEFESIFFKLSDKMIFTGSAEKLVKVRPELANAKLFDYSAREDFLLRNAYATAEALLMLSIQMLSKTLDESRVMITGFGRIGGFTAEMLAKMGGHVVCATHSPEKKTQIERLGCEAVSYEEAWNAAETVDLVINTADALVVDGMMIRKMKKGAKIIDAASLPGGTDFDAAKYYGVEAVRALGLPGKYSPETAAGVILDAVLSIKKEEHI